MSENSSISVCTGVRTVSICVFKVKYDGREIPCDYTEPVLSGYI